jgi:class 3 adenylate cyclase
MKRKIVAILAADIVGYSKLVAEDEEETVRRLAVYRAVFDELTARYGGRIVNMVGDAILAEFPSSVDAVRYAVDAHESIRSRNLAYPPSRQMIFRIGITVGDVVEREGQLFGDGVNIAARLEGLAPPGGICVSRTVHEQAANNVSVKFEDIGQQRVKNISNPIHAYVIAPHPGVKGEVGGKLWQRVAKRRNRLLAGVAVVAAIIAASVVTALQLHRPGHESSGVEPVAVDQRPARLASPNVIRRFDEAKVRTVAANQGILLPPALKVLTPASTVPAKLVEYLGAWGGDKRWNRGGRQAILVIESVDSSGTALGVYAHGPPNNLNAVNQAARRVPFVGSITDMGLSFTWGPSKYTFSLMPDGTMWGKWETSGDQGRFDLTITLERIE